MPESRLFKKPLDRLALQAGFGLFAFCLILRLFGLGWGLPSATHHQSFHPDEDMIWAYSQQVKPAEAKFVPGFYNYGTLYLTILRVSTDVINGYGGGPQAKDGSDAYQALARYELAGRWVNVLSGCGIAWAVFLILYRRTHLLGAVAGGLSAGVAPGLVVHSRFQTTDVFACFLLTLSLLYASKIVPLPDEAEPPDILKMAAWAGVWAGLSAGTKYTGLLAVVAVLVVIGVVRPAKSIVAAGAALAASLVAFVVATPGALLDTQKFLRDFKYEAFHTSTGHGLVFAGTAPGFIYHLGNLAIGFGALLSLMGLAGLAWLGLKRNPWGMGLALFALAFYVLIGRAEVKFLRYCFPLIPPLAVGFGWLIGESHAAEDRRIKLVVYAGILALSGLDGGALRGALTMSRMMASPDPRDEAAAAIRATPGVHTVGLVQDPWFYTPTFYPDAGLSRAIPLPKREAVMNEEAKSPALLLATDASGNSPAWDRTLLDQHPDMVAFSSFEADDLARLASLKSVPDEYKPEVDAYNSFIKALDEAYEKEEVFGADGPKVHDLMYIRPEIQLWKRKTPSPTTSSGSSTTSTPSAGQAPTP